MPKCGEMSIVVTDIEGYSGEGWVVHMHCMPLYTAVHAVCVSLCAGMF
jgi:hypothetical protein